MASVQRVLIVGGGIGGLCTAVALCKADIECEIVEVNPRWDVYGVGIIQQANALRALAALGLAERVVAEGYGMDALELHTPDGHLIARIPQPKLAGPQFPATNAIARPRLHSILQDAVHAEGVPVHVGVTVRSLEQTSDRVHVSFTDGTTGEYDLVVGADGLRSLVRRLVFGEGEELQPHFEGQMVWRYNLPKPREIKDIWMFMGLDPRVGFVPLSPDLMYIFLVETPAPGAELRVPESELASRMRALLAPYPPGPAIDIQDQITDSSHVVYRPFESILVPAPWHRGRVVLVGDSAHAMTAHIAQGAAMVMEDAVVLGEELAKSDDLAQALERYSNRRFERCKEFVDISLLIARWEREHSPNADVEGATRRSFEIAAQPA
jgi:2-polyprenyl-6-methoxyphenol hydroxylase-like FAD-dependent oxidoreductase